MRPNLAASRITRGLALGLGLIAGTLLAASCSDDPTGPPADITGVYQLRSIAGERVPVIDHYIADMPVWHSWGQLRLDADGTYLQADVFVRPLDAATVSSRGAWARVEEDRVRFTPESGSPFSAHLSGDGLEAASPRGSAVYRRVRE